MRKSDNSFAGTFSIDYINVGGLGYVTGGCIRATCEAARTDVGGAYRREYGETFWTQIIQPGLVPSAVLATAGVGGGSQSGGVWEVAIAESNENIWWMFFRGFALRSADRGVNWSDTSLNGSTGLYMGPNGGTQRLVSDKVQIDPSNPDVVYCGSQRDGLWRYMSGSWSQIASLPAANPASTNDSDKTIIIAVDPTSSTIGSGATLRHSRVYVASAGNGVYVSTDGGDTFSALSGTPGAGSSFTTRCMQIASDGKLYLCDGTTTLNIYNGSAWSTKTFSSVITKLYPDPKDPLRLVGLSGTSAATPIKTMDGGTTWQGVWNAGDQQSVATEVPLVAFVAEQQFRNSTSPAACAIKPHPVDDKDYVFSGLGVYYFNAPWAPKAALSLTWVEDSAGIEELVAHSATITPNGVTLLCSHDKGVIRVPDVHGEFPPDCYPPWQLTNGYAVDWAIDNPDFLVARVIKGSDYSAYSTNGGLSWTPFATSPTAFTGGTIAVSNSNQIVVVPGQNRHPRYSNDGGATWNLCTFTGVTLPAEGSGSGFGFGSTETRRHILCADKDVPGTFYVYNYGASGMVAATQGLWKSTDGGANFTRINSTSIVNAVQTGYHLVLQCIEGDLYLSTGDTNQWFTNDGTAYIYRSTDGGTSFTALTSVTEGMYAFGKAPPGGSYPTMYILGWKAGVYGLYRSFDKGDTTELIEAYPSFLEPFSLTGDPNKYGRVIIGLSAGWLERRYDYAMTLR